MSVSFLPQLPFSRVGTPDSCFPRTLPGAPPPPPLCVLPIPLSAVFVRRENLLTPIPEQRQHPSLVARELFPPARLSKPLSLCNDFCRPGRVCFLSVTLRVVESLVDFLFRILTETIPFLFSRGSSRGTSLFRFLDTSSLFFSVLSLFFYWRCFFPAFSMKNRRRFVRSLESLDQTWIIPFPSFSLFFVASPFPRSSLFLSRRTRPRTFGGFFLLQFARAGRRFPFDFVRYMLAPVFF